MKFEEWFNQQELYGLKSERFYDIVMLHRDNPAYSESLVAWLRASYEAGKEALAEPEQPPYQHFVSEGFNIDPQTGNLNIGAVKKQEPVMEYPDYVAGISWRNVQPPTQRTWVEIDDEDFSKALELCDFDKIAAFEFFEDKLKEKNK
jgi:hypothetical protein